jgi:ariadne-1
MAAPFSALRIISPFFQIPATITRILLNHFKWDKEKLTEKYYDSQDQDQLFSEARVVSPFRKTGTVKVKVHKFQNKTVKPYENGRDDTILL